MFDSFSSSQAANSPFSCLKNCKEVRNGSPTCGVCTYEVSFSNLTWDMRHDMSIVYLKWLKDTENVLSYLDCA